MGKEVFNINNSLNEKLEVGSLKIGNNVIIYNESFKFGKDAFFK